MQAPTQFPPCIIPRDGSSLKGYIAGVKGLHGPLRFTYRPMRVPMRGRMNTAEAQLSDDGARYTLQADTLLSNNLLLDWDVKSRDGKPVELNQANLLDLAPRLFFGVVAIITGVEPSDVDGEAPHLEGQVPTQLREFISSGEVESEEAITEKNSETG